VTTIDLKVLAQAVEQRSPITIMGVVYTPEPEPPTLREKVQDAVAGILGSDNFIAYDEVTDAVLNVVATDIEMMLSDAIYAPYPKTTKAIADRLRGTTAR
jgi:hypothetical protein